MNAKTGIKANRRWLILCTGLATFEWALFALGMLMGDVPIAEAAASAAVLVVAGNALGLLVIAGIKWAMRGDR